MQVLFLATIFIFQNFHLFPSNQHDASCDFRIEKTGNFVTISPFMSGDQFAEGRYELMTTNINGTNSSRSVSAGYFKLADASPNQSIAQIRISTITSGKTIIEMSAFSNGKTAKCTITYPE